ncbi:MAG: glycine zipper 2TM domain-containing protein [Verrucomicrobiota bacterium]
MRTQGSYWKSWMTLVAVAVLGLALSSCQGTRRSQVIGGAAGAGIGAIVAGDGDAAEGAIIGGALGALAGNEVSKRRQRRGYYD